VTFIVSSIIFKLDRTESLILNLDEVILFSAETVVMDGHKLQQSLRNQNITKSVQSLVSEACVCEEHWIRIWNWRSLRSCEKEKRNVKGECIVTCYWRDMYLTLHTITTIICRYNHNVWTQHIMWTLDDWEGDSLHIHKANSLRRFQLNIEKLKDLNHELLGLVSKWNITHLDHWWQTRYGDSEHQTLCNLLCWWGGAMLAKQVALYEHTCTLLN
jgi:hypothetical protein